MATGSNIYGYKSARFPNGVATNDIDAINGSAEIDMDGDEIDFIASAVLINGVPISGGGGGGVQNPMTSTLNLGGFDIADVGLSLNAINDKVQNITAGGGLTSFDGDVIIENATSIPMRINGSVVQCFNSSELGCSDIQERSTAGGVLSGTNIGSVVVKAYNNLDASVTVGEAGFSSSQNHTATASGTDYTIATTNENTTTVVERVRVGSDGLVSLTGNLGVSLNTESTTYTEGGVAGVLLKVANVSTLYAGVGAGASLTTSANSVLIGDGVGSSITTGDFNIGIGNNALQYSEGNLNTAVGVFSQRGVSGGTNSGVRNTSLGANSLVDGDTTSSNVAVGYYAGGGMVSGLRNTLIGAKVNNSITDDGSVECIIIGNESRSGGGTNRCVIADAITATKDNQMVLGNASVIEIVNGGNGVCDLGSVANPFKNLVINQVNSLTPVGGLYSGLSDGVLISGGTLGSMLPASGVGSLTVPANGFAVGDAYHLVCAGDIPVGDKDDVITITLNQDGVQLAQLSVDMEDSTNTFFELEADFQVRSIGATGSVLTNFDYTFNKQLLKDFKGSRKVQLSTIDTTSASTLTLTAQFTGQLNSTCQTRLFYLRKQY